MRPVLRYLVDDFSIKILLFVFYDQYHKRCLDNGSFLQKPAEVFAILRCPRYDESMKRGGPSLGRSGMGGKYEI